MPRLFTFFVPFYLCRPKAMWKLKEFESIYSRYERSGLKVRDFYANEVINEAKFYYWQKSCVSRNCQLKVLFPLYWIPTLQTPFCLVQATSTHLTPLRLLRNMKFFILVETPYESEAQ